MKKILIAGNWKSNKTTAEAAEWTAQWNAKSESITIVLCVPFTLLGPINWQIKSLNLPIALGAQDVSPFSEGSYTGEVNARQVKEFADWVIIGHSERRQLFGETEEILAKKVEQAKNSGLKVIFCVSDDKTWVPKEVDVVAYEPIGAIGTGNWEDPKEADGVIGKIKSANNIALGIYGGSVTPENVYAFVSQPDIDGVLVGKASLDAKLFFSLLESASIKL